MRHFNANIMTGLISNTTLLSTNRLHVYFQGPIHNVHLKHYTGKNTELTNRMLRWLKNSYLILQSWYQKTTQSLVKTFLSVLTFLWQAIESRNHSNVFTTIRQYFDNMIVSKSKSKSWKLMEAVETP